LTFQDARLKLLAYVRSEVRNGELTERGFARLIGISQPHAHNVLKGVRTLSPEVFDLILKYLHLSLLDLAPLHEIEQQLERRRTRERVAEIAFLAAPIGPGHPWPTGVNWRKTLPTPFPSLTAPAELAMAKFAADPQMAIMLSSYDVALLDTAEQGPYSPQGLYVVERNGEAVMRYIRSGAERHYLITDAELNNPRAWEPLRLSPLEFRALVKARVIWLGREQDRDALAQRGRFLYDPISS
jgi:transcriptional regulator with XRE-family HTH domain